MKISKNQLRSLIKESLNKYINGEQLMSGFDISPYDDDENNWRDKLSHRAHSLYLVAESNRETCDIKNMIVKSLYKKNPELLSVEKLANSRVMESLCSLAVKLEVTAGGETPTSADRKQFKQFYANRILKVDLPDYIEDQRQKSIDNIVKESIKRVLNEDSLN